MELAPVSAPAPMRGMPLGSVPFQALPEDLKGRRLAPVVPGFLLKAAAGAKAEVDAEKRQVRVKIVDFNSVDQGGDVILPTACDRTIAEDYPRGLVKFYANHWKLLGPAIDLEKTDDGVYLVGQVDPAAELDLYWEHIKSGALGHGSIGYYVRKSREEQRDGQSITVLEDIVILEGSVVEWPMNQFCAVESFKATAGGSAVASKSLWHVARGVEALATIQEAQQYLDRLKDADWAELDPAEAAKVAELLEQLTQAGDGAKSLLAKCRPAPAPQASKQSAVDPNLVALAGFWGGARRDMEAIQHG